MKTFTTSNFAAHITNTWTVDFNKDGRRGIMSPLKVVS